MQEILLSFKRLIESKSFTIGLVALVIIELVCALIWGIKEYLFTVGGLVLAIISLWNNVEFRATVTIDESSIRKEVDNKWITRMLIIENGMLRTFQATFKVDPAACSITMLHASEIAQECADCCEDAKIKADLKKCISNISRYRVQIEQGFWSNSLGAPKAMEDLINTLRNQCNI